MKKSQGVKALVLASEAGQVREAGEVQGVEGMEGARLNIFVTICTHTSTYILVYVLLCNHISYGTYQ